MLKFLAIHHFVISSICTLGDSEICYLDNAGASLYCDSQLQEYTKILLNNTYGNPHSGNYCSKLTDETIEQVRLR